MRSIAYGIAVFGLGVAMGANGKLSGNFGAGCTMAGGALFMAWHLFQAFVHYKPKAAT
jgi:hypothetical protein